MSFTAPWLAWIAASRPYSRERPGPLSSTSRSNVHVGADVLICPGIGNRAGEGTCPYMCTALVKRIRSAFVCKCVDTWKLLALKEFQRCTASGGDMRNLICNSSGVDCGD